MMKLIVPAMLCSTLLFGACHSAPPLGQRVDASLLQYADDGQRDEVATARGEADKASDAVAAAARELDESKARHTAAEKELTVARARHEQVKAELAVDGTSPNDSKAMQDARDGVHAAEATLRVREAEIEVAEHDLRLAREREQLAQAKVDLAAAEAIATVDRPECRGIDVADFESRVRAEEADVQVALVRRDEAVREVEARRDVDATNGG